MYLSCFHLAALICVCAGYEYLNCRNVNFKCVPVSKCFIENDGDDGDIFYPCLNGICCPVKDAITRIVNRGPEFPEECGLPDTIDDKITNGETAILGQFPWMALLGYVHPEVDFTQFLCGGSLISSKFVLTAAHCTSIPGLQLKIVRLGEHDISQEKDCDESDSQVKLCADPLVNVVVDKIIPHENYDDVTLKNDIAIIKMKERVKFTEFVKPICLPFDMELKPDMFFEKSFTVSGWGKTSSEKLGGSNILQYASVTVWTKTKCNQSVPPEVKPINDKQICANGKRSEDACKGDSGGPLFNISSIRDNLRYYQIGVVSFSSAKVCGNADLPTVYTRVDSYLRWILDNAK